MPVKKFIWDELSDNVLLETDENDVVTAAYHQRPEQFGELLSQTRSGVDRFFHFDGQHSTSDLTASNQKVTDTFSYTAYGEEVARTGTTTNPFGYKGAVGYYTNEETNDVYVRNRTYEPVMGRWLSRDPLGFIDGSNLYRAYFVPGKLDPSGYAVVDFDIEKGDGNTGEIGCQGVARQDFDFKFPNGAPCDGFIVQLVYTVCSRKDCETGRGPSFSTILFMEALPVNAGDTGVAPRVFRDPITVPNEKMQGTCGFISNYGAARFFCRKREHDPRDGWKPLRNITACGILIGTQPWVGRELEGFEKFPNWWKNPDLDGSTFRTFSIVWNCCPDESDCCPGDNSQFVTAEPTLIWPIWW